MSASTELLILFDTVTVLSLILISLVTATAFFSGYVRGRRRVWYGQMAQWMVYCVSYTLLFGFQQGGSPPRFLCLLQASLVYACPPACAVGSACFMIDFYMSLSPLHRKSTQKMPKLEVLLISLPWIVLVCAALQTILFTSFNGDHNILQRSPSGFFCNINKQEPTIVSVILVLLALSIWFYFEVQAGVIMYQNRQEFKHLNYKTSRAFMSLYIRSAIFTIGMVIGTALCIYALSSSSQKKANWSLALPFMPIFVAIVFGSQQDIMRVWVFWRKRPPEDEEMLEFTTRFSLTVVPENFPRKSIDIL